MIGTTTPQTLASILAAVAASGWMEFGGLVVFMITWYWLGRVVSRATHERELGMVKELASERQKQAEEWKAVAEETNSQVRQLVPQLNTIVEFFSKVPVVPAPAPAPALTSVPVSADDREVRGETARSDHGSS